MKAALLAAALAAGTAIAQTEPPAWTLDPTHTFVTLEVLQGGLSTTRVRFDRKEGSVQFDRAARSGRAEIRIDTASGRSGVPAFDDWLRGPEVLDSAAHPQASFVSDRFEFAGDRVTAVAGTLTLKGQAKSITLKAMNFDCYTSPLFRRPVCGGNFEAVLQRADWPLPAALPDELRLLVQVEALRP